MLAAEEEVQMLFVQILPELLEDLPQEQEDITQAAGQRLRTQEVEVEEEAIIQRHILAVMEQLA
jgi:hypothetical protein